MQLIDYTGKLNDKEETDILNMLLSNNALNNGQTLIRNLIRRLEDKGLKEQETALKGWFS